jgi:hypothetical protein
MRLNPAAFDAHLNFIGQQFTWRKADRCPNINPSSGASVPNCPLCGGKGVIWAPAVPAVAGMAAQQIQLRWAQFGQWQDGDAVVTIPENSPLYNAGQFDRVVMLNATSYFSLPLTRGDPQEKIHEPVEKITRVFWLANGALVEGAAFPTVNADGSLTWPGIGAPPIGSQYTIGGTKFGEYFVWGPYPSNRNEHLGARLPKRVVLRRFDLFARDLA